MNTNSTTQTQTCVSHKQWSVYSHTGGLYTRIQHRHTYSYCTNIRPTDLIINTGGEVVQEAHANPSSGGQKNEAQLSPLLHSFSYSYHSTTIPAAPYVNTSMQPFFSAVPTPQRSIVSKRCPEWHWAGVWSRACWTLVLRAPVIVRVRQSWMSARWEWKELISQSRDDSCIQDGVQWRRVKVIKGVKTLYEVAWCSESAFLKFLSTNSSNSSADDIRLIWCHPFHSCSLMAQLF